MLPESEVVLTQALEIYREVCGEVSEEVADTLTVLSATYNNRGTHNESRYYNIMCKRRYAFLSGRSL